MLKCYCCQLEIVQGETQHPMQFGPQALWHGSPSYTFCSTCFRIVCALKLMQDLHMILDSILESGDDIEQSSFKLVLI